MDHPDEENTIKWVLIDAVENAEEVTETFDIDNSITNTLAESDLESDGISIISHNESSAEEDFRYSVDSEEIDNVTHFSREETINWTYADSEVVSEVISPEVPSKTFFPNCWQEPIQELATNQSDPKLDDVSIASKYEIDFINDNKFSLPEPKKDNIKIQKLGEMAKAPDYIKQYFNGFVIGTILLATISVFLGHFSNSVDQFDDELHLHKKNFDYDNSDKISKKYNILTLYLCEQKYTSDNISMQPYVCKCLIQIEENLKMNNDNMKMKDIEKLQKNLKIKEHYLKEREKFLMKKEYELLKAEMRFQSVKKHKCKNLKFDTDQGSLKSTYENKGDLRSRKGNCKKYKDTGQEHFDVEKGKYFRIHHRNKFSKNKKHERKCDNVPRVKKTEATKDNKDLANNERRSNYKHNKAKRIGKISSLYDSFDAI